MPEPCVAAPERASPPDGGSGGGTDSGAGQTRPAAADRAGARRFSGCRSPRPHRGTARPPQRLPASHPHHPGGRSPAATSQAAFRALSSLDARTLRQGRPGPACGDLGSRSGISTPQMVALSGIAKRVQASQRQPSKRSSFTAVHRPNAIAPHATQQRNRDPKERPGEPQSTPSESQEAKDPPHQRIIPPDHPFSPHSP